MEENSIKEDIIILEQLIIANENCIKNAKMKDNPFVAIWEKQNRALEHILSDYKRVLKENEELNYKLHSKKKALEIYNKYIPKSKIKDKIDKLQNDLKYIACGNNDCNKCFSEYRGSNFVYCYAYHQINVLNELLESEE